jgi:hypothetical protein
LWQVVHGNLNCIQIDESNTTTNSYNDATINIIDISSNDVCTQNSLIEKKESNLNMNDGSNNIKLEMNVNQSSFLYSNKTNESSFSCKGESSNQILGRGKEQQQDQIKNGDHSRWPIKRQFDHSFERLHIGSDMQSQKEQQAQDEATQLG